MARKEDKRVRKTNKSAKKSNTSKRNSSSRKNNNLKRKNSTSKNSKTKRNGSSNNNGISKRRLSRKFTVVASLLVILLLAVFVGALASSSNDVTDKPALFTEDKEFVNGIDVSYHNGEIDWEEVSKNTDFAIVRVGYRGYTEGNLAEDSKYKENLKGAEKAKIPVGVYFYSQATTVEEAKEEANYALSLIRGYDVSLPVFIDYEYAFNKDGMHDGRLFNAKLSPSEAADIINAFCERINKGGHYAGVYSSSSVLKNEIKTSKLNSNIYVWVADYNKSVTFNGDYDLWQYTKTGKCNGVNSKYTDLNYWYIK